VAILLCHKPMDFKPFYALHIRALAIVPFIATSSSPILVEKE